jgi:hypothetical protein
MNRLIEKQIMATPMISSAEALAIYQTLNSAERFGYGNLMAWLATAWAVKLRDEEGMSEEASIDFVSNRGPYPLPKKATKGVA